MQKLLIIITVIASTFLAGCSMQQTAEDFPWVHRIDIQQGNVVTQEQVDQLEPGMSRRQVQFILGTPIIHDVFHEDRWDYRYSYLSGDREVQSNQVVSIYFDEDQLIRIQGDMRPSPEGITIREKTVSLPVPPREDDRGILERIWDWAIPGGDQ